MPSMMPSQGAAPTRPNQSRDNVRGPFDRWPVRRAAYLLTLILSLLPGDVAAQAWTAPAGTGSVSVVFQTIDNRGHLLTDGSLVADGKSRNAAVYLEADYAVTDRWSVSGGIPYVLSRYIGPNPTPGRPQPVDACHCWNGAWQDVAVSTSYGLVQGTFALTPFVSIGVPSHAYKFRGEAVPGRRLPEARFGFAIGRRLDGVSPRLSVQGSYSYAVVKRVLNIPNNRSNGMFEGAFLATRKLSVRSYLSWQRTHGGLRAGLEQPPDDGFPWGEIVTADLFSQHDRLLRDNNLHLGAAAALSLSRIELFASYVHYTRGTNSHAGNALTAGASWPFEWRRSAAKP